MNSHTHTTRSIYAAENAVLGTFSALHFLRNCNFLAPTTDFCNYDSYPPSRDYDSNNSNNFSNCSALSPRTESFAISQSPTSPISSDFLQPPLLTKLPSLMQSISVPQPLLHSMDVASTGTLMARHFVNTGNGVSNVNRRPRSEKKPIPEDQKDDKYYERRKRNNQAAKKSRDARKIREDHIALRATMLEHENTILRAQIITLRDEAQSLRHLLIKQQQISAIQNVEQSVSISNVSTSAITSTTPGFSMLDR